MKKISLIALFIVVMAPSFGQEISSSYKSTLKKMLDLAGTEATFKTAITQLMTMFKQQHSNVPESAWADMEGEITKASLDDLVVRLTPVYARHLTEADLKKIIEFYETPAGKKYAEKTPVLTQEAMQVGQQWGMELGQKLQAKLKQKGY